MGTQPVHNQKDFQQPAPSEKDAIWKILAEEAAREQDPKKLMDIISALTQALEEVNGK